jgi:hypothetical protein
MDFSSIFIVILKKQEIIINGQNIPQLSTSEILIAWITITIIVIFISIMVHRLIKRPLRQNSYRFTLKRFTET